MNATETRELEQVLARAVQQYGEVAAGALRAKLPRPFQRPQAELAAALGALADRGEIFRHPTAKTKFLAFDARRKARELVVAALGPKALTEAELKKQVAKKGAGLGLDKAFGPLVAQVLRALVREGVAFEHRSPPPPGESKRPAPKTLRYASVPQPSLELAPYVRKAARDLRTLVKRLAPFGATAAEALHLIALELGVASVTGHATAALPASDVKEPRPASLNERPMVRSSGDEHRRATPSSNGEPTRSGNGRGALSDVALLASKETPNGLAPTECAQRLLSALDEVAAREPAGALLLVERVRARAGLDKVSFDRTALELAQAERVVLHYHDYPASLSPEKRAQLVVDENNTHYIGIARWGKP